MIKNNSYNNLFCILFLLLVFFDEFFFFIMIITGTSAEEGMKRYEVAILSGMVLAMLFYDMVNGRINTKTWKVFALMGVLVVLYVLTPIFHNGNPPKFQSALLLLVAESIPASYMGAKLGSSSISSMVKIDRILPFFVISISIILGIVGLKYARESMMMRDDESGLGYQSMSYFMAYCYAYSAYYVFFSIKKGTRVHNFFKTLMLPNMFFCAIMCLISGGRGAFVFIIFITIYIVWSLKSKFKKHNLSFFVILLSVGAIFILLASFFDIWNSTGLQRVTENLYHDEEREILFKRAKEAFWESPIIGQGLGSVWYTVGYYSHNILMDMLAETGIIGTAFFAYVLIKTFFILYRKTSQNNIFVLFSLIFLGALVKNAFSGYYLGAYKLFMMCSFAYVISNSIKKKNLQTNMH